MVGAPLDRRAPELESLDTPAAVGIRLHLGNRCWRRCPRGRGEREVGKGSGGADGDEDDQEEEKASATPRVGWAAGEGKSGRSWHC